MPSVVTANDLASGAVVYLAADGRWVRALADATPAVSADDLKRLEALALAAAERNEVTAVYAFDAGSGPNGPEPISVRERIRALASVRA